MKLKSIIGDAMLELESDSIKSILKQTGRVVNVPSSQTPVVVTQPTQSQPINGGKTSELY